MNKKLNYERNRLNNKNRRILKNTVKNDICKICNKIYFTLEVHHIDGDWKNNALENLLVICTDCHNNIHNKLKIIDNDSPTKKRYLIKYFRKFLKRKVYKHE